jgi:hypothetical protein
MQASAEFSIVVDPVCEEGLRSDFQPDPQTVTYDVQPSDVTVDSIAALARWVNTLRTVHCLCSDGLARLGCWLARRCCCRLVDAPSSSWPCLALHC